MKQIIGLQMYMYVSELKVVEKRLMRLFLDKNILNVQYRQGQPI